MPLLPPLLSSNLDSAGVRPHPCAQTGRDLRPHRRLRLGAPLERQAERRLARQRRRIARTREGTQAEAIDVARQLCHGLLAVRLDRVGRAVGLGVGGAVGFSLDFGRTGVGGGLLGGRFVGRRGGAGLNGVDEVLVSTACIIWVSKEKKKSPYFLLQRRPSSAQNRLRRASRDPREPSRRGRLLPLRRHYCFVRVEVTAIRVGVGQHLERSGRRPPFPLLRDRVGARAEHGRGAELGCGRVEPGEGHCGGGGEGGGRGLGQDRRGRDQASGQVRRGAAEGWRAGGGAKAELVWRREVVGRVVRVGDRMPGRPRGAQSARPARATEPLLEAYPLAALYDTISISSSLRLSTSTPLSSSDEPSSSTPACPAPPPRPTPTGPARDGPATGCSLGGSL